MNMHLVLMIITVFLTSSVEAVEMATILLGVGMTRGWLSTLIGGGAGLAVLAGIVIGLGRLLTNIPIDLLRAIVGILLLLFGMQWLRQSIFNISRSGFFAGEEENPDQGGSSDGGLDWTAFALAFKGVFLEGLEIAFIVISFSAANHQIKQSGINSLELASIGAGAAIIVVTIIAILARNWLMDVPNSLIKFGVGILLSAYGSFWAALGMGAKWPGKDLAVLYLLGFYVLIAFISIYLICKQIGMKKSEGNKKS